jgi:hypothetical protein
MNARAGRTALRVVSFAALIGAAAPSVAGAAGGYTSCPSPALAELVFVARVGCAEVVPVINGLVAQPVADTSAALRAAGWSPVRAVQTTPTAFDIVAMRGRGVLRVRRLGPAPDLDGWAAGRELLFAPTVLIGGRPIPRGSALCTSSFLVQWHGTLNGLTAGHCGGLRRNGSLERPYAALRRPPQPGIPLGRVRAVVTRHAPFDALVLFVPGGPTRTALPIVDRGITRPPWIVGGFARPESGRRVCFTGRSSGPDHCGRIAGHSALSTQLGVILQLGVIVFCTDIPAKAGDSGGPVYTPGRADGTVDAVGLVTVIGGPRQRMCFTPLAPVLNRLSAALIVG